MSEQKILFLFLTSDEIRFLASGSRSSGADVVLRDLTSLPFDVRRLCRVGVFHGEFNRQDRTSVGQDRTKDHL